MTPDDVYALVDERTGRTAHMLTALTCVVVVLCLMVVLQVVAKLIIWFRVIRLLREVRVLVRIAETHGKLNDQQSSRVESVIAQAVDVGRAAPTKMERHVIEEVRKIPEATAERQAAGAARRDEKLDTIHSLVNSSYSAQLRMTAMYARRVASLTGRVEDVKAAEQAEKAYRDHEAEQKKQAEVKAAAERTANPGGAGCGNAVAALLVGAVLLGLAPPRAGAEDMRREGAANALEWWAAEQGGSR